MSNKSKLVADLWHYMELAGIATGWVPEYRFCDRLWRFDLAHEGLKLAIEVNGATWTGGRHSTGAGQLFDYEKTNCAAALGWRLLNFDSRMIQKPKPFKAPAKTAIEARRRELYGCAIEHIRRAMDQRQ